MIQNLKNPQNANLQANSSEDDAYDTFVAELNKVPQNRKITPKGPEPFSIPPPKKSPNYLMPPKVIYADEIVKGNIKVKYIDLDGILYPGLMNPGYLCYVNAVLQTLKNMHLPPLDLSTLDET